MSGMHIITVSEAADTPAQIQPDSVEDIERLLLTSASAIQRVLAERDALRSRVDTLERELTLLRQQTTLIHHSYRSLTTEYITHFRLIDSAVSNLFREPAESAEASPAEQPAEAAAFAPHHHAA
jgi:hypothetical protein